MVKVSKATLGFLWAFFFISIIGFFGFLEYHNQRSKEIASLKQNISELERSNQAISSKLRSVSKQLKSTQDSLNVATSKDILWLSRVLYSETDKPLEMYYIAHVVKNRVETCYRGECSYKDVVLDPYEFSAFNIERDSRYYLMDLNRKNARNPGKWAAAKQIALNTYLDNHDPTNGATHFFAQRSMRNNRFPYWSHHGERVELANNIDQKRLRVYKNVR